MSDIWPGPQRDIPIDDNVISLARFAVDEHNKNQNTHLEFKGVWNAKEQVSDWRTYWLTLEAAYGGESNSYEAKVLVTLSSDKILEYFKPLLKA